MAGFFGGESVKDSVLGGVERIRRSDKKSGVRMPVLKTTSLRGRSKGRYERTAFVVERVKNKKVWF